MKTTTIILTLLLGIAALSGCKDDEMPTPTPIDPSTAPRAVVDRFSNEAGNLFVRDGSNGLPDANLPINFDQAPFITQGFSPAGDIVKYYNFDVQPILSAPIFVLFKEGESDPVPGQLNIINVIPGDAGYNDFWHVHKVTVPDDYVANTVTNLQDIMDNYYPIERTNLIVNCPVVPEGSTASMRFSSGESNGLTMGWYKDQVVFYFEFAEKQLTVILPPDGHPEIPVSDIFVTFNVNPDQPGGGPASGFMTEGDTEQTHNVVQTIPSDSDYSPLWDVNIYDNADFNDVYNWETAQGAMLLVEGAALVNCPIVSLEDGNLPEDPDTAPEAVIDRFSQEAGTLFVRDATNNLPESGVPIDFDQAPFITRGLGPSGEIIQYYNFDVMPTHSAPIFVLFREGEDTPVTGQLNIIDVIPGDAGYNDFWHVHKVTVPSYYRANTITSVDELMAMDLTIERTNLIVNCPVVPDGSKAELRFGAMESNGLTRGWYKDQIVYYFEFAEKQLTVELPPTGHPEVPISDILVSFNINPGEDGGGPPSGFKTEPGTDQTHNVVQTLPTDDGYSPLWDVDIYDNADFDNVQDWTSAMNATLLVGGAALVNCPVVDVENPGL